MSWIHPSKSGFRYCTGYDLKAKLSIKLLFKSLQKHFDLMHNMLRRPFLDRNLGLKVKVEPKLVYNFLFFTSYVCWKKIQTNKLCKLPKHVVNFSYRPLILLRSITIVQAIEMKTRLISTLWKSFLLLSVLLN